METKMTKFAIERVGFLSGEDFKRFKGVLEASDIISECSRQLDSVAGAMTLAHLTLTEPTGTNDMIAEAYKMFFKEALGLIEKMETELKQLHLEEKDK